MKLSQLFFLAATCAAPSFSLPTFPWTVNDAIGDQSGTQTSFDIRSVKFTSYTAATKTFEIDLDFHYIGGVGLGPSGIYQASDLLFTTAGGQRYFVPLVSRSGLDAGDLYSATSFLTSAAVYGGTNTTNVWGNATGATKIVAGNAGTVLATQLDPTGAPNLLNVKLTFAANDAFVNSFSGSTFSFTSATCANDLISGVIPGSAAVPEPGTWAMLGAGLAALGFLRRRAA